MQHVQMRHLIESTQQANACINVDPLKTSEISKLLKSKRAGNCLFLKFVYPVQQRESGGARRDRTDDLLRARQALSQLSYGPPDRTIILRHRPCGR